MRNPKTNDQPHFGRGLKFHAEPLSVKVIVISIVFCYFRTYFFLCELHISRMWRACVEVLETKVISPQCVRICCALTWLPPVLFSSECDCLLQMCSTETDITALVPTTHTHSWMSSDGETMRRKRQRDKTSNMKENNSSTVVFTLAVCSIAVSSR